MSKKQNFFQKLNQKLNAYILLSALFIGFFSFPSNSVEAAVGSPKLSFSPQNGTFYVGDEFDVQVIIDPDGNTVDAVDADFTYDFSSLELLQTTPGPAFMVNIEDPNTPIGQKRFTGFSIPPIVLTQRSHISTLRFRAIKETPKAELKYNFTLQAPPITTDSNIAENGTSIDILQVADSANFQIIPDNRPPYVTNESPTGSNKSPSTNISLNVRDDERGVDLNSVRITVGSTVYTKSSTQLSHSGNKKNYRFVINPSKDFQFSETVNVSVDARDVDGNTMPTFTYDFSISSAPPPANQAPNITKIDDQTNNKTVLVEANDPDAPNSDLIMTHTLLSAKGNTVGAVFTDNGDGTATLDYSKLPPDNYYTVFTATDQGSPAKSDSRAIFITIGTTTAPPPKLPPGNRPPRFKPVDFIKTKVGKEVVINLEATDPDSDPITINVESSDITNYTFLDQGNGTATLHWTPTVSGAFSAVFKASDNGSPILSDTITIPVFVSGDLVCPNVPAKTTEVCSEERVDEVLADTIATQVGDELVATRAETAQLFYDSLNIAELKKDTLKRCKSDLDNCTALFRTYSNFNGINLNPNNLQLYPDLKPSDPAAKAINDLTLTGTLTGYYGEPNSPFKPNTAIRRIELLAIAEKIVDLTPNLYRPELAAILGGEKNIKKQHSICKDINPSKDEQWWYPRYANNAAKRGLITDVSACKPQYFATDAEVREVVQKLKAYIEENQVTNNLLADTDGDNLRDSDEQKFFRTKIDNDDTDNDNLSDYQEIVFFQTNPLLADTDNDGIDDAIELQQHKTNPLLADTDGDNFTDKVELAEKTNPLDPNSKPDIKTWAKEFGISLTDNSDNDTDGDGLSDRLEAKYNTDPTNPDTDNDNISDGDEIYLFKSNPTQKTSKQDLKIQITNLSDGQQISDRSPTIQGVAPTGIPVLITAKNSFGLDIVLGQATPDANNIFIFEPSFDLQDGEYYFEFKILDNQSSTNLEDINTSTLTKSETVRVVINSELNITKPTPTKLDDETITQEVILQNLRLNIINNQPILEGQVDIGSEVIAIWRSAAFTSAIVADSATGRFAIKAPKQLEPGSHNVYVYAARSKDRSLSETVRIPFQIDPKPQQNPPTTKTAIPKKEPSFTERLSSNGQALFANNTNTIIYILLGIGGISLLWFIISLFLRRHKKNKIKNITPPTPPQTPIPIVKPTITPPQPQIKPTPPATPKTPDDMTPDL